MTVITSTLALKYYREEHRLRFEGIIEEVSHVALFLNRDSAIKGLFSMYDKALEGDIIWGQCVGCTNYSNEVGSKILEAAGKGIRHKLIVNSNAPTLKEFYAHFVPLKSAEIVKGQDNALRCHGLSEREVLLAFPRFGSYVAVLIRDPAFVIIVKNWFDRRFEELKQKSQKKQESPDLRP